MKKALSLLIILALSVLMLAGCSIELNSGEDILYNEIVYERAEFPNWNIELLDTHNYYIGDFLETYNYGQQLPWEVFALNEGENVLFSAHALWLKPGYTLPDEYGEAFVKADYLVAEGILDDYTEELTPLITFEGEVTLEDIIAAEPTTLTEYEEYAAVRLYYRDYADISISLGLFSASGVYYLSVCEDVRGDNVFYAINEEYVAALTQTLAG